jgi:hypothetical protein
MLPDLQKTLAIISGVNLPVIPELSDELNGISATALDILSLCTVLRAAWPAFIPVERRLLKYDFMLFHSSK